LEEAAQNVGIPLSDCIDYIKKKEENYRTLDYELKKAGQEALKNALTKLTELAMGRPRYTEGEEKLESTDLLAARELARTAIATIKLSKDSATRSKDDGQKDLFDSSGDDPWILKTIE